MKILQRFACALALAAAAGQLLAAESAQVSKPRILVRAQPTIYSEILSKLEQGDKVTILEDITIEKPKEGEPAKWLRIKMPDNVPVWVFSPYLNQDHTVKVSRLNLRAGPGENYSVVGRIDRGAAVKPIRSVEDWTEVETPAEAYGFIAADLVERSGAAQAPATPVATERATPPTTAPATPTTPVVQETPPAVAQTPPPPVVETRQVPVETPPAAAQPVQPERPIAQPTTPVVVQAQPTPPAQEQSSARIVRREGIVRSTKNILAPTYEELVSVETRKTINFLWTGPNGADLKPLRGKRVVVIGEEGLDPKFPRTPVIEIHSIEPAPDVESN